MTKIQMVHNESFDFEIRIRVCFGFPIFGFRIFLGFNDAFKLTSEQEMTGTW